MPAQEPVPQPPRSRIRGIPLRTKLSLPLFTLLAVFGAAMIYGSVQLVDDAAMHTLNARLQAGSEVVFRECKRKENLLLTYVSFLDQFNQLANRFEKSNEVGILQDQLFSTLEREGIAVTFFNIPEGAPPPIPVLADLFTQVRLSGQPRFRNTSLLSGQPTLVVAAPLRSDDRIFRILMLQSIMGEDFLNGIAQPLGLSAVLHDLDGKVLATSSGATPIELQPEQISQLAREGRYFHQHNTTTGPCWHLFTMIPLASSDMVILSLESSVADYAALKQTIVTRLLLTILGVMGIGVFIYFRLVNTLTRPAQELIEAARSLSRGNLSYRIENPSNDELGAVAETFNQMATDLETIYQEKAEKEKALLLAQEEVKTKTLIERKSREVERANEELRGHLREVSALYQLNQAMVAAPELNILFDRVLQVVVETLGCDQVVLLLYNPGESVLEVARSMGLNSEALREVKFSFDQGVTGIAAQNLRQIYVKDVEKDPRYLNYHGQVATRGAFVSSPLVIRGRLVGVLNLHKRDVDSFPPSELKMIQAIVNQMAMAIDNAQLAEKARDLSNIDDLTGLANRRHFQEILKREVAQARRFSSTFSILMCDIDNFDRYNTKHGRMRGDALLRQVGQILLNNTRGIDLVCRFGNEEFVILLPKTNKAGGLAAAEKLRQYILNETFPGAAESQPGGRLTISFGISEFPLDSKNIYELLNLADRALYNAKQEGRNRSIAWDGPPPSAD